MNYDLKTLMSLIDIDRKTAKEFDEEMIPIIIELNSKGYKTLFCCQGHIDECQCIDYDYRMCTYIAFAEKYNFDIQPPEYERKGNSKYTKLWLRTPHSTLNCSIKMCLYFYSSRKTPLEQREEERKEYMEKLFEWVKALPKKQD